MKQTLILFVFCLFVGSALAQTITGTVTDGKNEPLPAATVRVLGTTKVAKTNEKGQFTIAAGPKDRVEISLMGFNKQTIAIANQNNITVVLEETTSDMDEVVVIGYQSVTRKKATAAISSISGKELANLPAASFDQLLQGRLSGVNVQNFSGEPGSTPVVQVRGNTSLSREYDENSIGNSPLYVVDGVPQPPEQYTNPNTATGTNMIAGINPNDIESIDVLKDASAAAIYGSRAANGVIMITTKKGLTTEPKVMVSAYSGLTQRPPLRHLALGETERQQKMQLLSDLQPYRTNVDYRNLPFLLTDSLNPAFNGNTDWQDLYYHQGLVKSADLSIAGGGAGGMNYRFSTGAYDEDGIVRATGFKRLSMRLNLMSKALKEKLTINPIVAYSRTDRSRGGGNTVGLTADETPSSLFALSDTRKDYLLARYDEDLDQNVGNQLSFNLNLGFDFSPAFKVTSQTSYLLNNSRRDVSIPTAANNFTGNRSTAFSDNQVNITSSNYLSYTKSFGKNNISALAGTDINYNNYRSVNAGGTNGSSDQIKVIQGFQQRYLSASSAYEAYSMLSYYARFSYDYDSRYLISGSVRGDGSSRFGKNNRWGYFPAASVAWLLSEESFMKDSHSIFSLLKLRASIGTTGDLPGDNYLQYNLYTVSNGRFQGNSGATTYNGVTAITPNFVDGAAQPNISWARSTQWNVGVDGEISGGRFSFAADLYNKENTRSLFQVNLPVTTGYDGALTNSIGVRNYGVDLSLMANPLPKTSKVQWFSRLNVTYNRNRIISLPGTGRDLVVGGNNARFDKNHLLSVGSAINTFYLYQTLGIFTNANQIPVNPLTGGLFNSGGSAFAPGDIHLADLDGDYFIDPFNDGINPDKAPIGDPNPRFVGGWTNNITYKNFTLGMLFNYTFGRDVLNLYESDLFENGAGTTDVSTLAQYATPDFSEFIIWRKPGDVTPYPAYPLGVYRYYTVASQTFFMEPGDYIRLKSLSLSYNLPHPLMTKWGLDNIRVYGIVDNLAKWQKSKRLPDAEGVNYWGEYDGNGYPIPKKFTLGIEVQF